VLTLVALAALTLLAVVLFMRSTTGPQRWRRWTVADALQERRQFREVAMRPNRGAGRRRTIERSPSTQQAGDAELLSPKLQESVDGLVTASWSREPLGLAGSTRRSTWPTRRW